MVDPDWLGAEAKKQHRLAASFLNEPLHLVNGIRVGMGQEGVCPQRFARMLLVCQDHLMKRWGLDFFAAPTFVSEVAVLGNSLEEIVALGPEAERKLASLPLLPDDEVTATVFELLVGAACIRRGLDVKMVPADRSKKTPDLRIIGLGAIPGAIECKRRLGLTMYELDEARQVEAFYKAIRGPLLERGLHCSIEASFSLPLRSVSPTEFVDQVLAVANSGHGQKPRPNPWGSIALRPLPFFGKMPVTRLYSPDFLQKVFDWHPLQDMWDGLLVQNAYLFEMEKRECEVESPFRIKASSFRMPICLKWRSESEEALTKKARGIASLWAKAVKQIPDGDNGFVYIAYPEGSRSAIADARTSHVMKSMEESWHRWSVRVPVTVISRLYPRAVGPGCPDLIESVLPGASKGQEFWLTKLPSQIFTQIGHSAPKDP